MKASQTTPQTDSQQITHWPPIGMCIGISTEGNDTH